MLTKWRSADHRAALGMSGQNAPSSNAGKRAQSLSGRPRGPSRSWRARVHSCCECKVLRCKVVDTLRKTRDTHPVKIYTYIYICVCTDAQGHGSVAAHRLLPKKLRTSAGGSRAVTFSVWFHAAVRHVGLEGPRRRPHRGHKLRHESPGHTISFNIHDAGGEAAWGGLQQMCPS